MTLMWMKRRMQSYHLDTDRIKGKMLLNALLTLKEQDATLSFAAPGEGVCGSYGMNINGKNGLALFAVGLPKSGIEAITWFSGDT